MSEHPGKIAQRLKPTMDSPPEPKFQIFSYPDLTGVPLGKGQEKDYPLTFDKYFCRLI